MLAFQKLSTFFRDHHGWSIGITRSNRGHDRCINDAQILYAFDRNSSSTTAIESLPIAGAYRMENGRAQVPGCQGQFIIAVYMCARLKFVGA